MVNMNKLRDPSIYALFVREGEYHYIGSTSINAQNRLWEHIHRARSGHDAPVYAWMREVGIENVRFCVLVSESDTEAREKIEAQMICQFIEQGHPLKNRISRDGVVRSMSDESKAIISKKQTGKKTWIYGKRGLDAGWTDERRKAQSERMKSIRSQQR